MVTVELTSQVESCFFLPLVGRVVGVVGASTWVGGVKFVLFIEID